MNATYVLGLIGSLVTLALLFELLRRRRLREKYAVFWVVVALLTIVVAIFPSTLGGVAAWSGSRSRQPAVLRAPACCCSASACTTATSSAGSRSAPARWPRRSRCCGSTCRSSARRAHDRRAA